MHGNPNSKTASKLGRNLVECERILSLSSSHCFLDQLFISLCNPHPRWRMWSSALAPSRVLLWYQLPSSEYNLGLTVGKPTVFACCLACYWASQLQLSDFVSTAQRQWELWIRAWLKGQLKSEVCLSGGVALGAGVKSLFSFTPISGSSVPSFPTWMLFWGRHDA